jgi:uncharacterized UBP type Zn finger protein
MDFKCGELAAAAQRTHAVTPSSPGCVECLRSGSPWVHLRLCLSCGHVGCCDSSPNRHATKHFHETEHPVIRSYEPGERWAYCYSDEEMEEHFPVVDEEMARVHFSPPWSSAHVV